MTQPHHYLTITELQKRIRSKAISPVELIDSCLARIDRLNARLNAFVYWYWLTTPVSRRGRPSVRSEKVGGEGHFTEFRSV